MRIGTDDEIFSRLRGLKLSQKGLHPNSDTSAATIMELTNLAIYLAIKSNWMVEMYQDKVRETKPDIFFIFNPRRDINKFEALL